jgi:hypothetical protein
VLYTIRVGAADDNFRSLTADPIKFQRRQKMKTKSVLVSVLLVLGCMVTTQSFAQEGQNDIMTLRAEIVSLDEEEGVLTVRKYEETGDLSEEEVELSVSGETLILLEDEEIGIYDLMTGDSITAEHYTGDSGDVVVTRIHLEYPDDYDEEIDVYEFE